MDEWNSNKYSGKRNFAHQRSSLNGSDNGNASAAAAMRKTSRNEIEGVHDRRKKYLGSQGSHLEVPSDGD